MKRLFSTLVFVVILSQTANILSMDSGQSNNNKGFNLLKEEFKKNKKHYKDNPKYLALKALTLDIEHEGLDHQLHKIRTDLQKNVSFSPTDFDFAFTTFLFMSIFLSNALVDDFGAKMILSTLIICVAHLIKEYAQDYTEKWTEYGTLLIQKIKETQDDNTDDEQDNDYDTI